MRLQQLQIKFQKNKLCICIITILHKNVLILFNFFRVFPQQQQQQTIKTLTYTLNLI
jgi:hypothetical protein